MELVLEVADFAHASHGAQSSKTFGPGGGLIGRAPDCAWVIGEEHRCVSNHHAQVSFRDGHFYLTDISSNGIWLEAGRVKLQRGEAHRIMQGERYALADLEIRARLTGDSLLAGYECGVPQPIENMIGAGAISGLDPVAELDRQQLTQIYGQALSDVFTTHPIGQPFEHGPVEREHLTVPELIAEPLDISDAAQTPPASPPADFWGLFGKALGLNLQQIDPDERQAVAVNAARLLRASVEGLQQCLRTCDELKTELRLPVSGSHDRLAVPASQAGAVQQIIASLLSTDDEARAMSADQIVSRGFRELQAHQVALLAASRATARTALDAFAPHHLVLKFERDLQRPSWATAGSKWRAYERYHQSLRDSDQWRESLFAHDFAQTYDEQLRLIATLQADYPG